MVSHTVHSKVICLVNPELDGALAVVDWAARYQAVRPSVATFVVDVRAVVDQVDSFDDFRRREAAARKDLASRLTTPLRRRNAEHTTKIVAGPLRVALALAAAEHPQCVAISSSGDASSKWRGRLRTIARRGGSPIVVVDPAWPARPPVWVWPSGVSARSEDSICS